MLWTLVVDFRWYWLVSNIGLRLAGTRRLLDAVSYLMNMYNCTLILSKHYVCGIYILYALLVFWNSRCLEFIVPGCLVDQRFVASWHLPRISSGVLGLIGRHACSRQWSQNNEAYHCVARQSTVDNDRKAHKCTRRGHHRRITNNKNHSHGFRPNAHADRPSHRHITRR